MPEMTFTVRWPDGRVADCYSPSLVMHDHLLAGSSYSVAEFVERTTTALGIASDRVREKYGFECTSAMAQQSAIAAVAAGFTAADARVEVVAMTPPLPPATGGAAPILLATSAARTSSDEASSTTTGDSVPVATPQGVNS